MIAVKQPTPIVMSANAARLMRSRDQEILYEGPARTGKSFTLCVYARLLCEMYPGAKGLFVRQTRKSLNNSVLTLWEDVLGRLHPAMLPRRQKRTRDEYVFPYSEIHLIGMDNPERLMSTEYDFIFVFEATELTLRAWSLAFSRLSNAHMPWNFMVADCNPAAATHWLNVRADERMLEADELTDRNKMLRLRTTLRDNPKFWDAERKVWTAEGVAYNQKLDQLPPVERKRLRDGLWVSQSGQVLENWNPERHIVQGSLVQREGGDWWLVPVSEKGIAGDFTARRVEWFGAAVDWGYFPDPGAAALYAVDDAGRSFVVQEFYTTKKPLEWWAEKLIAWQGKYDMRAIVCDSPQEKTATLNAMLGGKLNHRGQAIAITAKKGPGSVLAGLDKLRWCLEPDESGEPRLRYFATAPQIEDQYLREELLPTGGAKEYPGYCFAPREDGRPNKEMPVDMNNHGIDRDRYWTSYVWENKHYHTPEPKAPVSPLTIDVEADLKALQNERRAQARGRRRR